MKVLIADAFEEAGLQGLRALGCEVIYEPKLDGEELGNRLASSEAEVLVIGSGVAGSSAAIAAAEAGAGSVVMLAKAAAEFTATDHAQGGVAVALGPDDRLGR